MAKALWRRGYRESLLTGDQGSLINRRHRRIRLVSLAPSARSDVSLRNSEHSNLPVFIKRVYRRSSFHVDYVPRCRLGVNMVGLKEMESRVCERCVYDFNPLEPSQSSECSTPAQVRVVCYAVRDLNGVAGGLGFVRLCVNRGMIRSPGWTRRFRREGAPTSNVFPLGPVPCWDGAAGILARHYRCWVSD